MEKYLDFCRYARATDLFKDTPLYKIYFIITVSHKNIDNSI